MYLVLFEIRADVVNIISYRHVSDIQQARKLVRELETEGRSKVLGIYKQVDYA